MEFFSGIAAGVNRVAPLRFDVRSHHFGATIWASRQIVTKIDAPQDPQLVDPSCRSLRLRYRSRMIV
jgi:hypothetical protein